MKVYIVVAKNSEKPEELKIIKLFDEQSEAEQFSNAFNFPVIKKWNIDKKPYTYYDIEEHKLPIDSGYSH